MFVCARTESEKTSQNHDPVEFVDEAGVALAEKTWMFAKIKQIRLWLKYDS